MRCEYCIRRPRHEGGNASCPIFHRPTRQVYATAGSLKATERRDTPEEAWPHHLAANPQGCSSFKAGDLRTQRSVPLGQEELF